MLRNIFKIAVRNLRKNSLYSIVNISGLAIGIACSILILLWVNEELSYDNFIPKKDRLYQVWINGHYDGTVNSWTSVPLPTYEAMKTAHHQIANSAVAGWGAERLITYEQKKLLKDSYWVSKEFLTMFEYPFIKGDAATAFDDPKSIVISESLALELFDGEEPMDKMVRINDETDLKVTGVFKNVPSNSSFQFEYLIPWEHRRQINEWVQENEDNWGNNSFQVYIELTDAQYAEEVEASIKDMLTEKDPSDTWRRDFFIYPMERWRLYSDFEAGEEAGGRIEYVQLFTAIGVAILLIACINFMNLATARSEKRAKEVGIRKSVGSRRGDLILQFLGESVVISFVSYLVAIALVLLVLPWFNDIVEKQLFLDVSAPFFWILSSVIVFGTGILAGSYPAFFLSSFSPVATLKGGMSLGRGANLPRKILVVLQFGIAMILMVGTIAIYQQISLVQQRDLGYDKENLITVEFTEELRNNYDAFKAELLQSGAVESMTRSNSSVTQINSNNFLGWPGKSEETQVMFITVTGEYDYAETMGVEVLMGRDFSKDYASDTDAIVINKAALDLMDLDEPIGTELDLWGEKRPLVGVIDNVLMGSLYEENRPMFLILDDWGGVVTMRLKRGQDLQASLLTVEDIVTKFNPAFPFDYSFVDVEFERKFTSIKLTRRLAVGFSVLALIITSLGVFGLASYTAEQRTKEIGIRKVLGASVTNLVTLMSKDFTGLVIVAFLVSGPMAWYLMDSYLDRYPIRIDLQWWVMPLSGLVALVFALLIVSNQARRAATANPVKSLRSE